MSFGDMMMMRACALRLRYTRLAPKRQKAGNGRARGE
jgi:hypothetical protein